MPEWRRLYRSVSDSKKLSSLTSDSPALLWTWMLPYTDCEGRILADPHYLKGKIVPRYERWTAKTVEENLKILHDVHLIQLYEADGETVAQFEQPNFEDFQHPRRDKEAKSKFPPASPREPGPTPDLVRTSPGKVLNRIEENRIDNNTILFDKWNSFKTVKKWKSHSKLSHEIQQAITEQLKHYSIDDLGAAIANYAAVLNSPNYAVFNVCEKSWDKYWTLREFLTRGTKADRSEKYLYRFLPTNFQPSDFLTQKAKSQKRSEAKAWQAAKEQKEAQEQVVERGQSLTKLYGSMPIEELRQRYKSLDTTRFEKSLIRKVRPEVTER